MSNETHPNAALGVLDRVEVKYSRDSENCELCCLSASIIFQLLDLFIVVRLLCANPNSFRILTLILVVKIRS